MNDDDIFTMDDDAFEEKERRPRSDAAAACARLEAREDIDEEAGTWVPRACVICGDDMRLRCAGCREAVCHLHELCPNGCDETLLRGEAE
jgi:hypothetical protein